MAGGNPAGPARAPTVPQTGHDAKIASGQGAGPGRPHNASDNGPPHARHGTPASSEAAGQSGSGTNPRRESSAPVGAGRPESESHATDDIANPKSGRAPGSPAPPTTRQPPPVSRRCGSGTGGQGRGTQWSGEALPLTPCGAPLSFLGRRLPVVNNRDRASVEPALHLRSQISGAPSSCAISLIRSWGALARTRTGRWRPGGGRNLGQRSNLAVSGRARRTPRAIPLQRAVSTGDCEKLGVVGRARRTA